MKALGRTGWLVKRQTGSHVHLTHPDRPGVLVTVPVHAGQDLPIGTLRSILRTAGLSTADWQELL